MDAGVFEKRQRFSIGDEPVYEFVRFIAKLIDAHSHVVSLGLGFVSVFVWKVPAYLPPAYRFLHVRVWLAVALCGFVWP